MFLEEKRHGEGPTLEGFISWLETQDPEQEYPWRRSEECACAQYGKHLGVKFSPGKEAWDSLNSIAYRAGPWTFGNLLKYAKSLTS